MTGARAILSLAPGRKRLCSEDGMANLPPHPPPPAADGAGLLEKPLPARPTHLNLMGGPSEETRRPSGPKDGAVVLLFSILPALVLISPDDKFTRDVVSFYGRGRGVVEGGGAAGRRLDL